MPYKLQVEALKVLYNVPCMWHCLPVFGCRALFSLGQGRSKIRKMLIHGVHKILHPECFLVSVYQIIMAIIRNLRRPSFFFARYCGVVDGQSGVKGGGIMGSCLS